MARSTAQKYEEGKRKDKYDKEYWLQYTKEKFEESRNWRGTNVELQWFVNYMYYKGYQNLKFDNGFWLLFFCRCNNVWFVIYGFICCYRDWETKHQIGRAHV